MSEYEVTKIKVSTADISVALDALMQTAQGLDRDLLLATLLVYALYLSDPSILKDPARLQLAVASLSRHIGFVLGMPMSFDSKDAN